MNVKKLVATVAAGAMLLGFAGLSQAACQNTFVYGASAEYNFFVANAAAFMSKECGDAIGNYKSASVDTTHAVIWHGTGDGSAGNEYFGIGSKASYDGICAMQGDPAGWPYCTPNDPTNPEFGKCPASQRLMANPATCTGSSCTANECKLVTAGASDVQAATFLESSYGMLYGPVAGPLTFRDFGANPVSDKAGVNGASNTLVDANPIVVPFSMFVNSSVTASNGTTDKTITNLSSSQIRLLFAGQIFNWSDLGAYYDETGTKWTFDSVPVQVCMRHAGSGSHATFDVTQMTTAIGASQLLNSEDCTQYAKCDSSTASDYPLATVGYGFWFNDGTSQELDCVNGKGVWTGKGAVGYADADKAVGAGSSYTSTAQIALNGQLPSKANVAAMIENGDYDFWTIENLYLPQGTSTLDGSWYGDMLNFIANPANKLDTAYAQNCEMKFWKSSNDFQSATKRVPAVSCGSGTDFQWKR